MGDIARGFKVLRVNVGAVAVKLADNTIHKNCILIKNLGLGSVWIGPDNTVSQATGYPMGVNEAVSIGLQDKSPEVPGWALIEVYGISDASSSVACLVESI